MSVEVEGLTPVRDGLRAVAAGALDLDVIPGLAADALATIRAAAPARSGRLRGDLRVTLTPNHAEVSGGSEAVPYVIPLNYGAPRAGIRGRRFMQAADPMLETRLPDLAATALDALTRKAQLT